MTKTDIGAAPGTRRDLHRRAAVLFFNFFLIILAYYQVKVASRSLLIEYWGASNFPWVWIVSALTLGTFIGFYHRLVERHSRLRVILGCLTLFIALLIALRLVMSSWGVGASFVFYIFTDIFSVILVEQFWSLTNSITETEDGKKSYWFIGTGGLLGGALGAKAASLLVEHTPVETSDLLLTCAFLLAVTAFVNIAMGRAGYYQEVKSKGPPVVAEGGWRTLLQSRYLLLIAAMLFCAQMAQPVVEFQLLSAVEAAFTDTDERSAFFGNLFFVLGLVSIAVNLVLTPLIHRYLGIFAGMAVQPLMIIIGSFAYMVQPVLMMASALKIADRGLSYSINRASKEILYIPIDAVRTYQAKAWIDMLGYRLFKIAGSGLILLLTQWGVGAVQLGWLTFVICLAWIAVIAALSREYNSFALQPAAAE